MGQIILYKRHKPNISVLVDDDLCDKLKKICWIDHPSGAIAYKSRKKDYYLLSRYVFFIKNGFWPRRVYFLNKNKYDCRAENLTHRSIYKPKHIPVNKKYLKTDMHNGRMVGVRYDSKKNCFYAQRKYKGETLTVYFSCRQFDYYKAKDLAEMARTKLVNLTPAELEKAINHKYNKKKKIAFGRTKIYNFSRIGALSREFDENTDIENFIHENAVH